jgi:hypothetical protein
MYRTSGGRGACRILTGDFSMNWTKLALVSAAIYAAYRFGPNNTIKGAAVALGAVMLGKQVPYLKDVI